MQFFFKMGFILNIKERGTKLTLQTLGGDLSPQGLTPIPFTATALVQAVSAQYRTNRPT